MMGNIILPATQFNSQKNNSYLREILEPKIYFRSLQGAPQIIAKSFPLLQYVSLPTVKPVTSFIQGLLLPQTAITKKLLEVEQYEEYGFPIFAVIQENYQNEGIIVYDAYHRINWDNIPIEFRHCKPLDNDMLPNCRDRIVCTHHEKNITKDNCIMGVLNSAYFLFEEYRKYEKTGSFDLECLPHGNSAVVR